MKKYKYLYVKLKDRLFLTRTISKHSRPIFEGESEFDHIYLEHYINDYNTIITTVKTEAKDNSEIMNVSMRFCFYLTPMNFYNRKRETFIYIIDTRIMEEFVTVSFSFDKSKEVIINRKYRECKLLNGISKLSINNDEYKTMNVEKNILDSFYYMSENEIKEYLHTIKKLYYNRFGM